MERLLSIAELSELLGVTKATIYSWTSRNKIPHIKLSKRLLKFREEEIKAWIAQRSVNPLMQNIQREKNNKGKNSKASLDLYDDYIERIITNARQKVLN